MVTPKSAALSEEKVLQNKTEELLDEVQRQVEKGIAERGQLGFTVLFSRQAEAILFDHAIRERVRAALEGFLDEYRAAGWEVKFIPHVFDGSRIEFK